MVIGFQPWSSVHTGEGRNSVLFDGDPQLMTVPIELDTNLPVCEGRGYSYKLTAEDISREQGAFEPAPDVSTSFLDNVVNFWSL